MTATSKRATEAIQRLRSNDHDLLSSRKYDACFEMGDGDKVVSEIVRQVQYQELGGEALRFVDCKWWEGGAE